jgi:predicted transcriptional regulator
MGSSTKLSSKSIREADLSVLSLFPSLNFGTSQLPQRKSKDAIRNVSVILAVAEGNTAKHQISRYCSLSGSVTTKSIKLLQSKKLVSKKKAKSKVEYYLSAKGVIASMAFPKFRESELLWSRLTSNEYKGNPLAFALLITGLSLKDRSEAVYETLLQFAKTRRNIEDLDDRAVADSILRFLSDLWKYERQAVPEYTNVFKEFRTQGFEEIMRTILMHTKPKAEDYNGFIQFLCEVADFYYSPTRRAYNRIISENPEIERRLQQFKMEQESLVRQKRASAEVTFRIRDQAELSRFSNMPSHLQAIGMKLIVEPTDFMVKELGCVLWSHYVQK